MRDYMKALYHRFETPSRKAEYLDRKIKRTHSQLARLLNKPERKLLLRIADMEDELRDEACLKSNTLFTPSCGRKNAMKHSRNILRRSCFFCFIICNILFHLVKLTVWQK